ncbi:hypothetical protein [Demequina gelatinilytica]|uniref:hypothetical protein n=1 Tax=Demequina gelatinilytica TaxID=1638980 RepID=UPI000783EEDD|nr:hypothetical protein [Demequina gelatinilytica]
MTDQFDYAREGVTLPVGVEQSIDTEMLAVGVLDSIDESKNKALVAVDGAESIALPFVPGIYRVNQTVFVLKNPFKAGRPFLVVGPTKPSSTRPVGVVTAVNAGANKATVTVVGQSYTLPYIPIVTYSVSDEVYVLREPRLGGKPTLILGPCDIDPADLEDDDDDPAAPPVATTTSTSETATATIRPTFTGTYDAHRAAWDRWNTSREEYGGASTLYQGDPSFSTQGPFTGLATYADQIVDLGATAISKIEVRLRGADLALATYPTITVQGSAHAARPGGAPSSSGDTASGSPGRSGAIWVELPASMVAAFAAGSVKGLCVVGSGYNAVRGTSSGDGMALRVTYTRQI